MKDSTSSMMISNMTSISGTIARLLTDGSTLKSRKVTDCLKKGMRPEGQTLKVNSMSGPKPIPKGTYGEIMNENRCGRRVF